MAGASSGRRDYHRIPQRPDALNFVAASPAHDPSMLRGPRSAPFSRGARPAIREFATPPDPQRFPLNQMRIASPAHPACLRFLPQRMPVLSSPDITTVSAAIHVAKPRPAVAPAAQHLFCLQSLPLPVFLWVVSSFQNLDYLGVCRHSI